MTKKEEKPPTEKMLKILARAGNKDFRGNPSDEEESAGEGGPDNLSASLHFTKLHKKENVYNVKKQRMVGKKTIVKIKHQH